MFDMDIVDTVCGLMARCTVSRHPVRAQQGDILADSFITVHSVIVVKAAGMAEWTRQQRKQTVGGSGKVGWSWHMESKGSGGTGTVTCALRGQSKSATASFSIR